MSAHTLLAEAGCHIQHGCAFPAPGLNSFDFKPIFSIGSFDFTKPMLLAIICMLLVVGFFWAAFRKPKLVPGKLQLVGEIGYSFVARSIAREVIGKKGDKYVPFLTSIFFFVWLMNVMSIIPVAQFPATSRFAFPVGLAALVFITYMYLTFKHSGLPRRHQEPGVDRRPALAAGPADRGAGVLLQRDPAAVHPRGPAVGEHVRRPHADRDVQRRDLVPADRRRLFAAVSGGSFVDGDR